MRPLSSISIFAVGRNFEKGPTIFALIMISIIKTFSGILKFFQ